MADTETPDIPGEAFDLIAMIVQHNSDQAKHISDQLIASFKADYDALYDGVVRALNSAVWGGTTAQYEETLAKVRGALHPHPTIRGRYLDRAYRWMNGDGKADEEIIPLHEGGWA